MAYSLLGISGSLRAGSFNSKLLREAGRVSGADSFVTGDIRMPLYDGDLEEKDGMPEAASVLRQQILAADAVVIATPEYNSNLPGGLKNALDWLSREKPGPLIGKPVAIVSAAAGRAGGARGQFSLRHCLTPFAPVVLQGPEVMVAGAAREFDDDGRLTNERYVQALTNLMGELRKMAERLAE